MLRRVIHGVGAMALDKAVIALVQLALVPVLAIHWGLALYSAWLVLSTVPTFLAAGDLGLTTAAGTQMTIAVARGDRAGAVRIYRAAMTGTIATTVAIAVIGALLCALLPARLFAVGAGFSIGDARLTLALLVLFSLAALQVTTGIAGYRCAGLFARGTVGHTLIFAAEGIAVATSAFAGGSPVAAAAAMLSVRLAGVVVQAIDLRRQVPWLRPGLRPAPIADIRALSRSAFAALALPVGQSLLMQGTVLALAAGAAPIAVPAFTATRTLSRTGLQAASLLNNALMPEFSVAHARGDRAGQARMVALTLAASAVLMVPFALALGLFGETLVMLWTHGVIDVPARLVWAMAGTALFGGFWNPVSNLMLAMNRQAGYTYPLLVLSALAVALAYALAPTLGATGSALAMLAVDIVMCGVVSRHARQVFGTIGEVRQGFRQLGGTLRRLVRQATSGARPSSN